MLCINTFGRVRYFPDQAKKKISKWPHINLKVSHLHGGNSKGTTCVVDRDVTAYLVVDITVSDRAVRLSIRGIPGV